MLRVFKKTVLKSIECTEDVFRHIFDAVSSVLSILSFIVYVVIIFIIAIIAYPFGLVLDFLFKGDEYAK